MNTNINKYKYKFFRYFLILKNILKSYLELLSTAILSITALLIIVWLIYIRLIKNREVLILPSNIELSNYILICLAFILSTVILLTKLYVFITKKNSVTVRVDSKFRLKLVTIIYKINHYYSVPFKTLHLYLCRKNKKYYRIINYLTDYDIRPYLNKARYFFLYFAYIVFSLTLTFDTFYLNKICYTYYVWPLLLLPLTYRTFVAAQVAFLFDLVKFLDEKYLDEVEFEAGPIIQISSDLSDIDSNWKLTAKLNNYFVRKNNLSKEQGDIALTDALTKASILRIRLIVFNYFKLEVLPVYSEFIMPIFYFFITLNFGYLLFFNKIYVIF